MKYAIFGSLGTATTLCLTGAALAQQGSGPQFRSYDHMMGWAGWSGFFLGPLFMILFLVIAIVVVVFVLRALGVVGHHSSRHFPGTDDKALSVLRQRYASGEIDEAEFEQRKQVLSD